MSAYFATVIIPVYNTPEPLLRRSLGSYFKSIGASELVQTVIVDDGSASETAAVLDSYAGDHVFVYHKQNGGEASARNYGMERASGEYLFFLDSDDAVKEGFPLRLAQRMKEDSLDVLISDITILPADRTERTHYPKNVVASAAELAEKNPSLYSGFELCYCVRMGFSAELVRRHALTFREDMTVSADMAFNMQALSRAARVEAVEGSFYEYWLDYSESATRQKVIPRYTESMATEYEIARGLFAFNDDLKTQLAAFYMDFAFYNVVRNEKRAGTLDFKRYRTICDMPMFRQSIRLLGAGHACENRKAKILYLLRLLKCYRVPFRSVKA